MHSTRRLDQIAAVGEAEPGRSMIEAPFNTECDIEYTSDRPFESLTWDATAQFARADPQKWMKLFGSRWHPALQEFVAA